MKTLLLLLALTPHLLFAIEDVGSTIQVYRTNSEIDANLKGNAAVYEFQFLSNGEALSDVNVYYSIDGANKRQVSKSGMITIPSTAGKHIFQFFYNDQFMEIYSDSLLIEAKHRDKYTVNLAIAGSFNVVLKPVIYLYPHVETEVSVKMNIHGENAFLYPTYADAWNFTAHPNGELVFGDETYNYLFWEAAQRTILSPEQTASGFFVIGENAVTFLEEKLSKAGFTSKEQADFITFWGPLLAQNELNFIHFEFNQRCDKYANLDISPQPDNIYRIFMVWGAVSEQFEVDGQEIETINRSGFSALEWGGQESKIKQSFVNK